MDMQTKTKAICAHPEWTQQKLADAVGATQSSVNRWTQGNGEPGGLRRDRLNQIYDELFIQETVVPKMTPTDPSVIASLDLNTDAGVLIAAINKIDELIQTHNLQLTDAERQVAIGLEIERVKRLKD